LKFLAIVRRKNWKKVKKIDEIGKKKLILDLKNK